MKAIWDRIESWFKKQAPNVNIRLSPGAREEEIQGIENFISLRFPDDLRMSLKIHNGQHELATPMMGEWELYSLDGIKRRWTMLKELFDRGDFSDAEVFTNGPVLAEWWNLKWVPVAHNGAGDLRCVDMAPARGGKIGQIVSFWHVDEGREILAGSFGSWLESFADDLEKGLYEVVSEGLVLRS